MKFSPAKFIQFLAVVPFFSLGSFNIQDQFKNTAAWSVFAGTPRVLIIQGRGVQDKTQSAQWGSYIAQKYNSNFKPGLDNVTKLSPLEKIKIIPIAALPHVPGPFKGMAVSGVQKQSPDYGVLLDYDSSISNGKFSYDEKNTSTPAVVIFPADQNAGKFGNQIKMFLGVVSDANVRAQVDAAIAEQLSGN